MLKVSNNRKNRKLLIASGPVKELRELMSICTSLDCYCEAVSDSSRALGIVMNEAKYVTFAKFALNEIKERLAAKNVILHD